MSLFEDYQPEAERHEAVARERYERQMFCGIDPWEVEEMLRRDMLAWLRKQEEAKEEAV